MKCIKHGPLECCSIIFKTKGHLFAGECSPYGNKSCFVLIFLFDLDLIIARETIHEGKDVDSNTVINDLINEQCQVIALSTCFVQIMQISTHMNGSMFLVY